MNIIVKNISERTVTKEGQYQGQEYMLVTDRTDKQWFVGNIEIIKALRINGENAEYDVESEVTNKGGKITRVKFVKMHEPYIEKDKDARIRESVAIKEVGDTIRAGIDVEVSVMLAYQNWIRLSLGVDSENDS